MQAPTSAYNYQPLLKREWRVDVGATVERAAKRAQGEEAATDVDTREGEAITNPSPNLEVAFPIIKYVPLTLEVTMSVIVLVLLDGGEEEEELLDYSGGDDLAFRCSPNIDLLAKDLEIPSSLPDQISFAAAPLGMTFDATWEWSSLVGVARVGELSSPRLHVIEQVNPLVVVVKPTGAEEEALAYEKAPS
ncbi:uncharacterized protein A4U43_C07F27810 [Asparagus officinalis]|uniref:Uncharacterized protein n=1 Tax=Asparagus officinalis TaxID=4686 RepID=A0A5P1EFC6_ASPOF|nr:uncharacterized protein A4U43_C07F27810 [Asparagus officinalis]